MNFNTFINKNNIKTIKDLENYINLLDIGYILNDNLKECVNIFLIKIKDNNYYFYNNNINPIIIDNKLNIVSYLGPKINIINFNNSLFEDKLKKTFSNYSIRDYFPGPRVIYYYNNEWILFSEDDYKILDKNIIDNYKNYDWDEKLSYIFIKDLNNILYLDSIYCNKYFCNIETNNKKYTFTNYNQLKLLCTYEETFKNCGYIIEYNDEKYIYKTKIYTEYEKITESLFKNKKEYFYNNRHNKELIKYVLDIYPDLNQIFIDYELEFRKFCRFIHKQYLCKFTNIYQSDEYTYNKLL